jgi:hypothetical protein
LGKVEEEKRKSLKKNRNKCLKGKKFWKGENFGREKILEGRKFFGREKKFGMLKDY